MKTLLLSTALAAGLVFMGTDKAEAGHVHFGFGVGVGAPVVVHPHAPVYHPGWHAPVYHPGVYGHPAVYRPVYHPGWYGPAHRPFIGPRRSTFIQAGPVMWHRSRW
jgi:hypothetical protein